MRPLRIVLLMLEPPMPFGNAASRWFYVLFRELVRRGHQVKGLAACSKASEMEAARKLFPKGEFDLDLFPFDTNPPLLKRVIRSFQPYSYFFSDELKSAVAAEMARGADILHAEQLWCGWISRNYPSKSLTNVHHLTWIDLEHNPGDTRAERSRSRKMWATERRLLRELRHVRSCSPRLVPEMLSVNPRLAITTVPVGIDSSLYNFIPDDRRASEPNVTLIGTMNWYPGYSAAVRLLERLWPEIKRRVPAAKLKIIGWSAKSALARYIGTPDLIIEENVPDTRPYFEQTGVMLYAPSRGSGMKIKVLEAMAWGVPIVTTSEGVEGIPAIDGIHAGVCEDDAGLIERTVKLLSDPQQQNAQRRAARQLLESHCSPIATVDAIEQIYSNMLNTGAVSNG